jgi:hypothetical protein
VQLAPFLTFYYQSHSLFEISIHKGTLYRFLYYNSLLLRPKTEESYFCYELPISFLFYFKCASFRNIKTSSVNPPSTISFPRYKRELAIIWTLYCLVSQVPGPRDMVLGSWEKRSWLQDIDGFTRSKPP